MEDKVKAKKNLNAISNAVRDICLKLFSEEPSDINNLITSKLNSKNFKELVRDSSLKMSIKKIESNGPDKPKSAYLLFSNAKSAELKKDGTKFTIPELTKLIAEAWKKLSVDDHLMYANMANEQKEEYKKKLNEYNAQMKRDNPDFVFKKPSNKTAFSYFVDEEKIKQMNNEEFAKADKKTQNTMLREMWKKMNNGTVEERKQIVNYKKKATMEMDETLKMEEEIEKNFKRKLDDETQPLENVSKKQKVDEETNNKECKKKVVKVVKKTVDKTANVDAVVKTKKKIVIPHIIEDEEEDENTKKTLEEFDMKIKPKASVQ
jgi:hypothetical protein